MCLCSRCCRHCFCVVAAIVIEALLVTLNCVFVVDVVAIVVVAAIFVESVVVTVVCVFFVDILATVFVVVAVVVKAVVVIPVCVIVAVHFEDEIFNCL